MMARPDYDDDASARPEPVEFRVERTAVHRGQHENLVVPGGEIGVGLEARPAVHIAMTGQPDRGQDPRDRSAGRHRAGQGNLAGSVDRAARPA